MNVSKYLLVFFFSLSLFAQENTSLMGCVTNIDYGADPQGMYSYATTFDSSFATTPPIVFNLKFWILRQEDGTTINNITQNDLLQTIANLNINFNQFNIFFKYRGYQNIDNDTIYTEVSIPVLKEKFDILGLDTASNLNIIVHDLYTSGVSDRPYGTFSVIGATLINGWVPIHEVGHCLGLEHPFNKWGDTRTPRL